MHAVKALPLRQLEYLKTVLNVQLMALYVLNSKYSICNTHIVGYLYIYDFIDVAYHPQSYEDETVAI